MRLPIQFVSDGLTLRGSLWVPGAGSAPYPAVVMNHGWGATLPMGLDEYAEAFCDAGFAVLAYDAPNFGVSDGTPRHEINPWVRVRATRDAVAFAGSRDEVEEGKIGIWADSGDAASVFVNAAFDDLVRAVVSFNPTFGSAPSPEPPDSSVAVGMRRVFECVSLPDEIEFSFGPGPIVAGIPTDETMSPSPTAFRWFFEYGGRHGSRWVNRWSYVRNATGVKFSPYDCLPLVDVPVLMVVGRDDEIESAHPAASRQALSHLNGPATWHEIDGGHFGALYAGSPEFKDAVAAEIAFLTTNLT